MGFTLSCFIFFFFCFSGMGGMKNPKILGASMNYLFALFFSSCLFPFIIQYEAYSSMIVVP